MQSVIKIIMVLFLLTIFILLAACSPPILTTIPEPEKIHWKQVVYVENDGRCPQGDIIQITGGNKHDSEADKYDCIKRP